jgi:hypothetical protein
MIFLSDTKALEISQDEDISLFPPLETTSRP